MSDTPRTDAEAAKRDGGMYVPADFARQLERELYQANERIARESKRANDQWAAAQMERESADACKSENAQLQRHIGSLVTQIHAERELSSGPNGNSDTARLNWMESHRATVYRSDEALHWVVVDETLSSRKGNVKKTLREAIDAAMPTATGEKR